MNPRARPRILGKSKLKPPLAGLHPHVEVEPAKEKRGIASVQKKLFPNEKKKGFKICTQCGKDKPLSDYFPRPESTDGRDSACKTCSVEQTRKSVEGTARRRFNEIVLPYIKEHESFTVDEICMVWKKGRSTISKYLKSMVDQGLLVQESQRTEKKRGRILRYKLLKMLDQNEGS